MIFITYNTVNNTSIHNLLNHHMTVFIIKQNFKKIYGFPSGMLKLILSAKAPHSALFRVNIDIQVTKPIVHIKAPRKLKKSKTLNVY